MAVRKGDVFWVERTIAWDADPDEVVAKAKQYDTVIYIDGADVKVKHYPGFQYTDMSSAGSRSLGRGRARWQVEVIE